MNFLLPQNKNSSRTLKEKNTNATQGNDGDEGTTTSDPLLIASSAASVVTPPTPSSSTTGNKQLLADHCITRTAAVPYDDEEENGLGGSSTATTELSSLSNHDSSVMSSTSSTMEQQEQQQRLLDGPGGGGGAVRSRTSTVEELANLMMMSGSNTTTTTAPAAPAMIRRGGGGTTTSSTTRSGISSSYTAANRGSRQRLAAVGSSAAWILDWIQTRRVPNYIYNNNDETSNVVVYWITGLDGVWYGGRSMYESPVKIIGFRPPRYVWYMLSGGICDIMQFGLLFVLHMGISDDPTICWILGFCTIIVVRHTSHRYLVFGDYVGGYWNSLLRMYMGYSVTIVLSSLFNYVLSKVLLVPVYVIWFLTMLWTGVANYFILKYFWTFGGVAGGGGSASTAVSSTTSTTNISSSNTASAT